MKLNSTIIIFVFFLAITISVSAQSLASDSETYLSWNVTQAEKIGEQMRGNGRVGGRDFRVIHTERAINYKLRATMMTPEVIRASARLEQLRNRLTDEQTRNLVKEAETTADLVVMVELDPREGSGVIPLDWRVFLQPKGLKTGSVGAITGNKSPHLRNVKALSGVFRRDYDYDVFFVSFPLVDENKIPLISVDVAEIELLVGVYVNEGRVAWKMPESIREKIKSLSRK
jgi:hypothetical protein